MVRAASAAVAVVLLGACGSTPGASAPGTRELDGSVEGVRDGAVVKDGRAIATDSGGVESDASGQAVPVVDATADGSADDARTATADARAVPPDATSERRDSGAVAVDAWTSCSWEGAPGVCIEANACAAIADHMAFAGGCLGSDASMTECCIVTPNVANNPPIPAGYRLMPQADVTPEMTDWAVTILHEPGSYPLFSTATMIVGTTTVLARVEWHPPDFQNSMVHRGVTLYETP